VVLLDRRGSGGGGGGGRGGGGRGGVEGTAADGCTPFQAASSGARCGNRLKSTFR
jgi:hypothetical protein